MARSDDGEHCLAATVERRRRRPFRRALPDARELRILHGVLVDTVRMAQLAKKR